MRKPKWLYPAIAGGAVVAVAAIGVPALASSGASPAAQTTLYGCDVGANRTLEYVFTVEANYVTFLNAHGGKCPQDGFEVTVGANGTTTAPPPPVQQAPAVTGSAASSLTSSGATLNGSVNPEGAATTYQFEYGTSTSYGTDIPVTAASAGSGASAVKETASPAGLTDSTAYDYRLVATNSAGTTDGPNETFTTSASSGGGTPGTWACTSTPANDGCQEPSTGVNAGGNQSVYEINDDWNTPNSAFISQSMGVNSAGDWAVTADMAKGNTAVISYPDTQTTVTGTNNLPIPLANYTDITSTYSDALPADPGSTDDYEAAYDLWLGDATNGGFQQEIMVWTDNHGQTPAGNDTGQTWTDPTTGTVYEIWATGEDAANDPLVTFVAQDNAASGSVDLLGVFKFLQTGSYTDAAGQSSHFTDETGVSQMDYGFEICSTTGQNETFTVNGYTLNATGSGI